MAGLRNEERCRDTGRAEMGPHCERRQALSPVPFLFRIPERR